MRPIDADRLKEVLERNFGHIGAADVMRQLIDAAPTVDAEPVRHGRWEECFEDWRQQIAGSRCSLCGFEYFGSNMKYCPECGAKMDGGTQ